jgi:sugar phosphate isomerase/epimerase
MKLSIVLSLQPTRFSALAFQGNPEDHFQKLKTLGYDGVELAIRDPSLLNWDRLEEEVKISGLDVPAIGTGQAYVEEGLRLCSPSAEVREKSIERLKSHIPLAKRFQAGVIIGLIRGKVEKSEDFGKGYEWMIESLKACCAEAESENVPLWIEPLNRYETNLVNTLEEGWEVIQQLGGAKLGLLPDTFHMNIEERSIGESLRKFAPYLKHVHLADSNRWAPGVGHLGFRGILDILHSINFEGFFSFEILPKPSPDEAAKRAIDFTRSLRKE